MELRINGSDEYLILASSTGNDDIGGGLFSFDGSRVECIDGLSSTGLYFAGQHLLRLLRSVEAVDPVGELLVYDRRGVVRYYRIDGLGDGHDVLWDGSNYVVVSSHTNTIIWLAPSGEVVRVWRAAEAEDAWHLNCLVMRGGDLHVCAFGRFMRSREWNEDRLRPSGFVCNFSTGEDILTGLAQPHTPRFLDDAWLVCNSAQSELLELEATGAMRRRLQLRGFTRGIAITDDYLFIGESASRKAPQAEQLATIAVVHRETWQVCKRIALPVREVYDIVVVPLALVDGVRRGFRTNATRAMEQDQRTMFERVGIAPVRLWAVADPLPPEACKVQIAADLPAKMSAGASVEVPCTIQNAGGAFYMSAMPNPVQIGYKWLDPGTGEFVQPEQWQRTPLPRTLSPGDSIACIVRIVAPQRAGSFILRLTLVQEMVSWFDDIDPANALSIETDVVADDAMPTQTDRDRFNQEE